MALSQTAPLTGITVIEFSHMVMGPSTGLLLADLGADVIKIEPLEGDKTRQLHGSGAGYFAMYNRNKQSLAVDLKSPEGQRTVKQIIRRADVVIENFRAGAMDRLGLGYAALSAENDGLIYCSEKGFLSGPYENRTALDEVAQMMGGLAYMTGPPGRPLRAGASVIDVMGGTFGVVAILSALIARQQTGKGTHIRSGLFETCVFLVGQHMAQYSVTGAPANPMPERISAWSVYDIFLAADDKIFVGIVTDGQWQVFCESFGLDEWAHNAEYAANNDRIKKRDIILAKLGEIFAALSIREISDKLAAIGIPFAPIRKPEDLFSDPHLTQTNGLVPLTLPDGTQTQLPALPLELDGTRPALRHDLPHPGQHSTEVLRRFGFDEGEIEDLLTTSIIAQSAPMGDN